MECQQGPKLLAAQPDCELSVPSQPPSCKHFQYLISFSEIMHSAFQAHQEEWTTGYHTRLCIAVMFFWGEFWGIGTPFVFGGVFRAPQLTVCNNDVWCSSVIQHSTCSPRGSSPPLLRSVDR